MHPAGECNIFRCAASSNPLDGVWFAAQRSICPRESRGAMSHKEASPRPLAASTPKQQPKSGSNVQLWTFRFGLHRLTGRTDRAYPQSGSTPQLWIFDLGCASSLIELSVLSRGVLPNYGLFDLGCASLRSTRRSSSTCAHVSSGLASPMVRHRRALELVDALLDLAVPSL